ncbi:MAG: hypothetical protein JSV49_12175 [Thermoplasmata archaeon]|nr:MAG: hypothetical protein JSV49_12175 [Thermoplasmata archaeon]
MLPLGFGMINSTEESEEASTESTGNLPSTGGPVEVSSPGDYKFDDLSQGYDSRGARTTFDPVIPDSRVEYAIITANVFKEELEPLRKWKSRKGVAAKIYTVEDIYSNLAYNGKDNAQEIHNFLRDLNSKSSYLQWVLLAGDADAPFYTADDVDPPYVPTRLLFSQGGAKGVNDYYWSDVYYAGLSSDWDNDGDGIYGEWANDHPFVVGTGSNGEEGDFDYEVYVGRLPCDTEDEMTKMVTKILDYEKAPATGDWLKTSVLWGGLMDAPNVATYKEDEHNAYEIKNLRMKPLIPEHMIIKEYYDYWQLAGGSYSIGNDNLNRNNAISSVNDGCSILNFAGQAYYEGWALLHYNDPTGLGGIDNAEGYDELYWYYDGQAATNGGKLPFVYMSGCDASIFNWSGSREDISQERMLTNPNGGAIGLISSTGHTYRGEDGGKSIGNWWLDEYFWRLVFESGYYQPGKALYELKEKYYTEIENGAGKLYGEPVRSNNYGYILLGDPELSIRTDTTHNLNVVVEDLFTGPGEAVATVTDSSTGKPVKGALVNIMNYEFYLQGTTNSTGVCKIPIEPASTGAVEVVVTAQNYYPREIESYTITQKPVDLAVEASDIRLSKTVPLDGDEITVAADIHNYGGTDQTSSATVAFFLGDPDFGGVQIETDRTVENIYKGDFETVSVTWNVEYRPHPYEIYVSIDPNNQFSEYTRDNNIAYIMASVLSSDLEIENEDIILENEGTVGELQNITLNITINNIGSVNARIIKVGLFDGDPRVVWVPITTLAPEEIIVPAIYKNNKTKTQAVFRLSGGTHKVYVFVDPSNTTYEMNENNNIAFTSIKVNYAPEFGGIDNITMDEDTKLMKAVDLHSSEYIKDNDNPVADLLYTVGPVSSADDLKVTITENRYVNLEPAENFSSSQPIKVTLDVTDGYSSVSTSFYVTVKSVNDPPYIEQISTLSFKVGDQVNFTINATDSDNELLVYSDNSELFDIDDLTGEINFEANASMLADHTITITVTDGLEFTSMTFTLKIGRGDNLDPKLDPIGDITMTVGKIFSTTFTATDPEGDPLTFTMDPPVFPLEREDDYSAILSYTPNKEDVGVLKVTIYVWDDKGGYDLEEITITIEEEGKDSDDKMFSINPWALGIILLVIVIIFIVVFMFMRSKRQSERDLRAWETMEGDSTKYKKRLEEPREELEVPEGELSVIEKELLDSAMQQRKESKDIDIEYTKVKGKKAAKPIKPEKPRKALKP